MDLQLRKDIWGLRDLGWSKNSKRGASERVDSQIKGWEFIDGRGRGTVWE